MNREEELNLLWAKKTALQNLISSEQQCLQFVCPICSDEAYVRTGEDGGYEFSCVHRCFYDKRK